MLSRAQSLDPRPDVPRTRPDAERHSAGQIWNHTRFDARPAKIDAQVLATNLIRGYTYDDNLVQLGTTTVPMMVVVGDRPVASPVAPT